MIKKLTLALILPITVLSGCVSDEEIAVRNIEYKQEHYAGKSAAGNPMYKDEISATFVPASFGSTKEKLFGIREETVRNIPVDQLPKPHPTKNKSADRLFTNWCAADGYSSFAVVSTIHKGVFRVETTGGGVSTYYPMYTRTVECKN